jgi:hypothetical protein
MVVHQPAFRFRPVRPARVKRVVAGWRGSEAVAATQQWFTVDNEPYPIATRKRVRSDCGQGPVILSHRVHGGGREYSNS